MSNIPNIRFKGYSDPWEQRKVGDIATITAGGTPSTKEISYWEPKEIPWMSSGEVHKKYLYETDEKISEEGLKNSSAKWIEKGSVLIALAGQGKTRGTSAIAMVPLTTNQSIAAIKFDDLLDPFYAFQNLDSRYDELRNISSGDGTRGGLNKQLLSDLDLQFPTLEEQTKIGKYFKNLDNLIALHQRKCDELKETKKYMLQKMFPKNGEMYPEIRFSGFTDPWEQRKLNEIADKVTKKNKGTQYIETFTNSAEFGIISQKDFFDHDVSNMDNIDGYYVVEKNAFVYNPRISTLAPVGPINRNKLGRIGVMSPLYTVFKTHDICSEYLEWFFKSTKWHAFMKFNGDSGARSDRFSIKDAVFFEMPIPLPDIDEQKKIGMYLTNLDNLITLHQRKCEELKETKKYMLQNMFPKKG